MVCAGTMVEMEMVCVVVVVVVVIIVMMMVRMMMVVVVWKREGGGGVYKCSSPRPCQVLLKEPVQEAEIISDDAREKPGEAVQTRDWIGIIAKMKLKTNEMKSAGIVQCWRMMGSVIWKGGRRGRRNEIDGF